MTTRLYLSASASPAVTVVSNGAWQFTSEEVQRACTPAPDGTAIASGTIIGPWTIGETASDRRYVTSLRLASNQRIEGTITAVARALESLLINNVSTRFEAYVVSENGQTVRGTLLAIGSHGTGAELDTSLRNIYFANATTVSAVDALANDRIVFVFGYSDSIGVTPEAQTSWGGNHANGIDLPANETNATAYNPWIEFSQDLIFELNPTARFDSNQPSSVVLSGSSVNSFTKISGTGVTNGFNQSSSTNKPALSSVGGKDVITFTTAGNDANYDFLISAAGDNSQYYPFIGHYTVMIEFRCTDADVLFVDGRADYQPNVASGIFGHANNDGFKFAVGLRYIGSSTAFGFFGSMFTQGFANHYAETLDLATNAWYVGTASSRGQTISSQIDARTPVTTTLNATTGVNWTADNGTIYLGAAGAVWYGGITGNIRRIAIFSRHLNVLEAGLARQTYFSADITLPDQMVSFGIAQ